jgi:TRAP-type C4-dicarboxylate transport system permease small subunit
MGQTAPALGPKFGLQKRHVYLALPIAGSLIMIIAVEQILELALARKEGGEG